MSKKLKIKKGATVTVIAGNDKGKTGSVLEVNPTKMKIKVQGVRMQTNLDKKENVLVKTEGFIDYSNVKLVESGAKKSKAKKKASKTKEA
ncbi:MAG: KOW motif-containing protein [Bdellovibrionaceae bacterium]|nr:KOW motif-containing protein [Pseudobdellovibrionaceae bacterium]